MLNVSNELNNPNLKTSYISRPRLDKIFDLATRCKLVYVIAGTGYGKTQAVRHYIEQQQDTFIRWMQITESDNISSRYWENLVHTVSIDNPVMADQLRRLGFPETPAGFKQFTEIIRATEHRSRRMIFVLDDFHLIHSKDMLTFTERCAQLQVPSECVIIISRNEPEINVAALRSKGNVSIITEDELRFTSEEAAEFFWKNGEQFSRQELSQLIDSTKGWALAINILSLILKRMPNNLKLALEIMVQNVFKLLEIEAWGDFPEDVQKTVVKLSLLSDLPILPPQEISNKPEFLQNIPGLASFVWFNSFTNDFKIHPLYLEFLQSKHHILSDEEKQEVYQQAVQWCSENNFNMYTMNYYAKLRQFDCMIKTLLSYPFKLPNDTSEYFLNIIETLNPNSEEQNSAALLFLKNYFIPLLLVGARRYEEAKERALAVIKEWEHVDSPLATLFIYTSYSNLAYIDMYICTTTHKYNAPEYTRKYVEHFKLSSIPPEETVGAFINPDIRSFACLVGEGATSHNLDEFLEAARQTAVYIEETPFNIYSGYADLVACECAFFKNQPNIARNHAHNAILKAREKKQYSIAMMADNYLLRIAAQDGDVPLAKEILKNMRSYLDNTDFWNRQLYYDLYTGAFYALIGLPEITPKWLIMDEKETASGFRLPARELIVSAFYYTASKKYQQTLAVLSNSYPREPYERFLFGEIKLLLLNSIARVKTGDTHGAVADFERAYQMSFNGVLEMFFIEHGKELHPLVVAAQNYTDCTIPDEWLKSIDRKASIYAKKAAVITNAFKRKRNINESVSLSDREKEVLVDLYHGLSREEIAANRYLSINTVKKTLQSIYTKLDAHNNVDAVRIALEMELIE